MQLRLNNRRDPTRTTVLRRRFLGEVGRRFRDYRGLVRRAVIERDVLALKMNVDLPPERAYEFVRDSQKVQEFMDWLRRAAEEGILGVQSGTPMRRAAERSWMNTYIDTAYQRGLRQAGENLGQAGVEVADTWLEGAFFRSVHADRVGLIYTRAFEELRGITSAMSQQMSRVLAQGIAEGQGVQAIARSLNNRVEKIGRTRARVLARTEVINAHAEATLNAYEEAKAEGVNLQSEFTTAGDGEVCPECEALEGTTRSIGEARGLIPVHPNCRCAWLPVVLDPEGKRLD